MISQKPSVQLKIGYCIRWNFPIGGVWSATRAAYSGDLKHDLAFPEHPKVEWPGTYTEAAGIAALRAAVATGSTRASAAKAIVIADIVAVRTRLQRRTGSDERRQRGEEESDG